MSINKFQEKVLRTGCGSAVLYVCAAVFLGGMFYLGCGLGGNVKGPGDSDNRLVIVQVGDTPVYFDQFNQNVQQMREQKIMQSGKASSPDAIAPLDEADIEGGFLDNYVRTFGAIYLAQKLGVKFTDQQLTSVFEKDLETRLMQSRQDLVKKGSLKPDANDKDFDAALKKGGQTTATDQRKTFREEIAKALKDEKTRAGLVERTAQNLLLDAIKASIKPSDAELKATYDSYTFKHILFAVHPGSTADSQIAKAQADLKSGMTFEQVIDRYSSEPPTKGKKLSENTIDMNPMQFDMLPEYRTLRTLKVGQVSDVVETPMGKSIYKLISIKNMAPPDFPTNKAKYLQQYQAQHAQTELDKQMKEFMKSGPVTWKMQGMKALFDWYEVHQDYMLAPADRNAKMGLIVDQAKKALAAGQTDGRAATLAWYAAFDPIWNFPTADKVKLRGDRIELLKAITATEPYFSLKMELVDLLVQANATDEAVEALKSAAASNFMYDTEGQTDYQQIQSRIFTLKGAGKLPATAETELQKIQQEWLKQNELAAQEKAEQKKQEEQSRKEAAANAAKQKAEADKQKAEAAKSSKDSKSATVPSPTTGKPAPGAPPVITGKIIPPKTNTSSTPPPVKKQ